MGPASSRALDDLLDAAQEVTRTLLGAGVDPEDVPAGGALQGGGVGMGMGHAMVMAQRQRMLRRMGRLR